MPRTAAVAMLFVLSAATPLAGTAQDAATDDAAVRANAQRDAEEIAQALLEVRADKVDLDCLKAVENARYGVETMLDVGEKNVRGGYMKAEQFNTAAVPLRALLPQLTVADCEAADGNKRAFYQCMSDDYNHVLACGKAYPY